MDQVTKTTARKLLLFYEDPLNRVLISKAKMSTEMYETHLWHHIFLHFFICGPKNPPGSKCIRHGGSDPNWDALLHTKKALDAQEFIERLLKRRENQVISTRRKVA